MPNSLPIRPAIYLLTGLAGFAQPAPLKSVGPLPEENQLGWQKMEYDAFIHFSINTCIDMAWGLGNEDPGLFNPTKLDCRQWARICKEAGMKGIVFTVKHHSGFCLWPVKTSSGKADIKAIAYNPFTKQSSIVSEEKFDIARTTWKIVSTDAKSADQVVDGNPNTSWHQARSLEKYAGGFGIGLCGS